MKINRKHKNLIAIIIILSLIVHMPIMANAATEKNLGNILSDATVTLGDQLLSDIESPIQTNDGTIINLSYTWEIKDDIDVESGDWAEIEIPDVFIPIQESTSGNLVDPNNSGSYVGTYTLTRANKTIKLIFNDALKNRDEKSGVINFSLKFDMLEFQENTTQTVHFEQLIDKDFIITLKPQTELASISKEGTADAQINPSSVTWVIDVNTTLESLQNARVTDMIPEGLELVTDSIEISELYISYDGVKTLKAVTGSAISVDEAVMIPTGSAIAVTGSAIAVTGSAITVTGLATTHTGNDLTVNFGAITGAYRISFKTMIKDFSKSSFTNTATLFNDSIAIGTASATVPILKGTLIDKTGIKILNEDKISWIIDINKAETNLTNAIIKDSLPQGLILDESSLRIYELSKSGSSWSETDVTELFANALVGTDVILGNIGMKTYRIKFNTDIVYGENYRIVNQFLNSATLYDGSILQDSAAYTVTVNRTNILYKTGQRNINYNTKEIKWTVQINNAKHTIGNAVIMDVMPTGLELKPGSIVIYNSNNEVIPQSSYSANNISVDTASSLKIRFGNIVSKFKVEYITTIIDYNKTGFKNVVKLYGTGLIGSTGTTAYADVTPGIINRYEKNTIMNTTKNGILYNGINYADKTMSWKLAIQPIKEKITDLTISDTFPNNGMYFLENTLTVMKGNVVLTKNIDYTITPKGNGYQDGFNLTFSPAELPLMDDNYTIYYKTSFDPNREAIVKNNQAVYINSASFTGTTMNADGETNTISNTEHLASYILSDIAYHAGKKSGTLYKTPERKISWNLYINYLSKSVAKFSVSDIYSEGQELDVSSIVIKSYNVNAAGTVTVNQTPLTINTDYTVTNTPQSNEFSIVFKNNVNKPYLITYDTKITGISKQTYTNTAIVKADSNDSEYTSTLYYPDYNSFLIKEATNIDSSTHTVYTNDVINWKLTMNKSLSEISNVVLTDVLSNGLVFENNSLIVNKLNSSGALVPVDPSEYTVTITPLPAGETELKVNFLGVLPSQYIIDYSTVVVAINGSISNTAKMNASEISEISAPVKTYFVTQTSSGTGSGVNKGSIKITKKDTDTLELLNASFHLFYLLNGNQVTVGNDVEQTTDGVLEYKNLSNRTYYLEEITAPFGYQRSLEIVEISITSDHKNIDNIVVFNKRNTTTTPTPEVPTPEVPTPTVPTPTVPTPTVPTPTVPTPTVPTPEIPTQTPVNPTPTENPIITPTIPIIEIPDEPVPLDTPDTETNLPDSPEDEIIIEIELDDIPLGTIEPTNPDQTDTATSLPKTGIKNNWIYYLAGIFFSTLSFIYTTKRRKTKKY